MQNLIDDSNEVLISHTQTISDNQPSNNQLKSFKQQSKVTAVVAASTALAACGSDKDSDKDSSQATRTNTSNFSNSDSSSYTAVSKYDRDLIRSEVNKYTSLPKLDKYVAARLLQQAGLSSSEKEINHLVNIGYQAWFEEQFSMPVEEKAYDWALNNNISSLLTDPRDSRGTENFIYKELFTAKDVVRKKVALALSEIFVVSATLTGWQPTFATAAYWDTLNEYAFGSYRELLERITLSPAMGCYLSTRGNIKSYDHLGNLPDENYAREILQLFSIGLYELNQDGTFKLDINGNPIETYDQDTITNLARVFTGWNYDDTYDYDDSNPIKVKLPMKLYPEQHSQLEVNFLGTHIPAGTDGHEALKIALDTIANHPNVAPFIAKQLIQRLVKSNPSKRYISKVAGIFNDDGFGKRGNLKAVILSIILDDEARVPNFEDPATGKIREPMLRFIQWARTFDIKSRDGLFNVPMQVKYADSVGQSPFRAPSVFNFFSPTFKPKQIDFLKNNLVAPELAITNEVSVAGYINTMKLYTHRGLGKLHSDGKRDMVPDYSSLVNLAKDPDKLVAKLNLLFCSGELSFQAHNLIVIGISDIGYTDEQHLLESRVKAAVFLIMATPEYIVQK